MKLAGRLLALLVVLGAVGAYGALGYFQVAPDEQAVVLRLGRYVRTVNPGLRWRAPLLERFERRRVTTIIKEEFGYRTVSPGPPPEYEERPDEKRMLSGDTNLVNVEFVLQYRITDLGKYLFGVKDVDTVIRDVAETVMRDVVAQRPIDDVITEVRGPIEGEARLQIQQLLDEYGTGIAVQNVQLQDVEPPDAVKDAFADVISARQDRERMILDAEGYAEQVVPRARGEAEELLNQARAYRESRILESEGQADRFRALLAEYQKAPEVTRERLFIEVLEEVFPGMEKVIIEEKHGENVLPYLPLGRRELGR